MHIFRSWTVSFKTTSKCDILHNIYSKTQHSIEVGNGQWHFIEQLLFADWTWHQSFRYQRLTKNFLVSVTPFLALKECSFWYVMKISITQMHTIFFASFDTFRHYSNIMKAYREITVVNSFVHSPHVTMQGASI